jgi:hypothetical protein
MLSVSWFALFACVCVALGTFLPSGEALQVLSASGDDYYKGIDPNAQDVAMLKQLHELINTGKKNIPYDGLWEAFKSTDEHTEECEDDEIKGPYSNTCWHWQKDQCGFDGKQKDCYNREHSWPKSWWGENSGHHNAISVTDLFHIYPTDSYVNAQRSDYSYGIVTGGVKYTSDNGCTLGECVNGNFTGTCFEPADEYKGELARSHFYMSTMYREEWVCCSEAGVVSGPSCPGSKMCSARGTSSSRPPPGSRRGRR